MRASKFVHLVNSIRQIVGGRSVVRSAMPAINSPLAHPLADGHLTRRARNLCGLIDAVQRHTLPCSTLKDIGISLMSSDDTTLCAQPPAHQSDLF